MAHCPNCRAQLQIDAIECPKCAASFAGAAAWRPAPDSREEEQRLASRAAPVPQASVADKVDIVWSLFKFCFSALLLLIALGIATTSWNRIDQPGTWAILGVLVFFSAAPWINSTRASHALGLAAIFLALFLFSAALRTVFDTAFPRNCDARSRWRTCDLENFLYSIGGVHAAAGLSIVLGLLMLWGAYLAFKSSRAA